MRATPEQCAVCLLVLASLGNYLLVSHEALPVIDILSACGIAAYFGKYQAAGNRIPIRIGLTILGLRWLDSAGLLAMQTDLSATMRFFTIASQASMFTGIASVVCF